MNIISDRLFSDNQIQIIENAYNAKFILESTVKPLNGGWYNMPVAIFYQQEKHPEGSNYFGMYYRNDSLFITNAISATEPFDALMLENGDIMISRYRHDYFMHSDLFVDGGRDYIRYGGNMNKVKVVKVQIVEDHLEIVDKKENADF